MKFALTSIAAGVVLACVCHGASAQATVTVTQQGNGNTSAAEQVGYSGIDITATITQIGDNNHVGGPGSSGGGIIQVGGESPMPSNAATVYQNGTGNNAGIVQVPIIPSPVEASIRQTGNGNSGFIRQDGVSGTLLTIEQNGDGNRSALEQITGGDSTIRTLQSGNGNSVTVGQYETGGRFYSSVVQDGDSNTASVSIHGSAFGGPVIEQHGYGNSATTSQADGEQSLISIRQYGSGNLADAAQTGDLQTADIGQNGIGNRASVTQSGLPDNVLGNSAVIAQAGNSNTAIVRQAGEGYVANVSQVGNGNWTNIYQH